MERVWLSSTYYMDPAVEELSPNAERLMTRALAYCGNAETEGALTLKAAKKLGISAVIRRLSELIGAGILVETDEPETYRFAAWDKWQASGNELVRRKKADAERQARKRHKDRTEDQMSRDTSRDVTPTEKRREEKEKINHLPESSHVGNAGAPEAPRIGTSDDGSNTPPRGPAPSMDGWAAMREVIPSAHPQATKTALALECSQMLHGGTDPADLHAALQLWLTKPNLGPRTLPSLVSEVIRNRTAKPATTHAGASSHDAKVTGYLEAGRRLTAAANHQPNDPKELLA